MAGMVAFHLYQWRRLVGLLESAFGAAVETLFASGEVVIYTGRGVDGEWVA